ncbi:hypothetical protein MTO96_029460 [Rhipicephalus appendiculatus]
MKSVMEILMPTVLLVTNLITGFAVLDQEYAKEQWESFKNLDCAFDPTGVAATVSSFVNINSATETTLMTKVALVGPVCAFVDNRQSTFTFYSEGVYHDSGCVKDGMYQAVLIVGYGATKDGQKYWIVRNSWGTNWGQDGYILIRRDSHNECGIASFITNDNIGQVTIVDDVFSSLSDIGCEGGRADQAFEYIIQNKGIDLEELYPYASETMPCAFDKGAVGATISSFHTVPQMSEEQLQIAVATVGPVAVVVDAAHDDFFQYHQGIYNNPFCSASDVNYGLLVVGYGTADGKDYWICKNSMGSDWGEHGYIRMTRNKQNQCGIATSATYPEI